MTEEESIGQCLRRLREQRSCTLEQVAEATKIKLENLRAIESDEITRRLPLVYARAFVKAYAEFVGADSSALVERFGKLHGDAASQMITPAVSRAVRTHAAGFRNRLSHPIVIGVTGAVAIAALFWLFAPTSSPCKVTVRAIGRVPIKVYRDGHFVEGLTIEAGKTRSWRAKRSIQLKIDRPENAEVVYKGEKIRLTEEGPVSVAIGRRGIKKTASPRLQKPSGKGI